MTQQDDITQRVLTDAEILTATLYGQSEARMIRNGRAIESAVLSKLRAPVADERAIEPVDGDRLPAIGSDVLIHLARQDKWVRHTVVGYYAWGDLQGNPWLQRVFVRVRDSAGYLNARMLCDVRTLDGVPFVTDRRAALASAPVAVLPSWKLVPIEPTPEMEDAGCDVPCPQDGAPPPSTVYAAMIGAAPPAPGASAPVAGHQPYPAMPEADVNHPGEQEDSYSRAAVETAMRAAHDRGYSVGWDHGKEHASAPVAPQACPTDVCQAGQQDGVLCANDECDRANGERPPMCRIPGVREDVLRRAAERMASAPVAGEAQGWSGWACQYPNKLPRLYGAKEIAQLNCDAANGDRVLFLSDHAAPQASAEDVRNAALVPHRQEWANRGDGYGHWVDVDEARFAVLAPECRRTLYLPQADKDGCTCPSGDGSLRHPCPMHPGPDKDGGQQRAGDVRDTALSNLIWAASERDKGNRIRQFDQFMGEARAAISSNAAKQGSRYE